MFIGRDLANEVVINDPEVSRKHARIFIQGVNIVIEDLGSTNGTSINGQRLMGPYVLRPGEIITFGEHIALLFESVVLDANATVLASRQAAPAPANTPAPQPQASAPVYQAPPRPQPQHIPPPAPMYSGQVPSQPVHTAPPAKKKGSAMWIIIVIAIILVMICVCAGVLYYIDVNNLYCSLPGAKSIFTGCP
jgi:pSer/pThr/pTyr-binding forkhead associated (FHA) protein